MVLVTYSDSEGSDVEDQPAQAVKPASKSSFQKVVDSSNPRKIRVNLPATANEPADTTSPNPERPAKRARTGGAGVFSGLSSFLPAPKRTANTSNEAPKQPVQTKTTSSSVNLKTGAAPAFSRSTASSQDDEYSTPQESAKAPTIATTVDADDVKFVGKSTMFRPLSVTRKPQPKKKKVTTATQAAPANTPQADDKEDEDEDDGR